MTFGQDWTRRDFLQTGSVVVPTLKRMLAAATTGQDEMVGPLDPGKFAPVELSSHFNASSSDFGPRERAKAMGGPSPQDGLIHTPSGKQNFRGIPFLLGSEGLQAKSWMALSQHRDLVWISALANPYPGWLAARCSSRLGPVTSWAFMVQAHTSPVYLVAPGQELFSPQTATYMLALIDGSQTFVENLAVRPDPERLAATRKIFEDARTKLHRRLHQHNIPH